MPPYHGLHFEPFSARYYLTDVHSLYLTCPFDRSQFLSAELWELGTVGIEELERGDSVLLIAGFDDAERGPALLSAFADYVPDWRKQPDTDWVRHTENCWPGREVGERIFLAPPWSQQQTPAGRVRVVHNPGLASGTGEHPCTQLALLAIERELAAGERVIDIGTGSGVLAIAAQQLGAAFAAGIDTDVDALATARENFGLNQLHPALIAGSVQCLRSGWADLTVANISGTVLLSIFDDLLRLTKPLGRMILTGFTEGETPTFLHLLPGARVTSMDEWRCVTARVS